MEFFHRSRLLLSMAMLPMINWHPTLKSGVKPDLKGLVVMGSNGEYVYLSEDEKRVLVEKTVELTPEHMLVIAGTGWESTQETIELTQDCADRGAHAALVITPHYYGGRMNEAALLAYFTAVADQSPDSRFCCIMSPNLRMLT